MIRALIQNDKALAVFIVYMGLVIPLITYLVLSQAFRGVMWPMIVYLSIAFTAGVYAIVLSQRAAQRIKGIKEAREDETSS